MGKSMILPKIEGISDISKALVTHMTFDCPRNSGSKELNIERFATYFQLPKFALAPRLFLREISGNILVTITDQDGSFLNLNGVFTLNDINYMANYGREIGKTNAPDAIKIYPESGKILPVQLTMDAFAEFFLQNSHEPSFPQDETTLKVVGELGLKESRVALSRPKIKLMTHPVGIVKTQGFLSVFSEQDSFFEGALAGLNGHLFSTSHITFQDNYAQEAFSKLFRVRDLTEVEQMGLMPFKVESFGILMNNADLTMHKMMQLYSKEFLERGGQVNLKMVLKEQCEGSNYCHILQRYFKPQAVFNLQGTLKGTSLSLVSKEEAKADLGSGFSLSNATLHMDIDFTDSKPALKTYLRGFFYGDV